MTESVSDNVARPAGPVAAGAPAQERPGPSGPDPHLPPHVPPYLPWSPPDPSAPPRKLTRSRQDRMIAGVCGGLGRYLNIDPVLLRIVVVALTLTTGFGVLVYVIGWIALPEADDGEPEPVAPTSSRHTIAITVGAALVCVGGLLLLREWLPGFGADVFWSLVVMAAGVLVLFSARR